LGGDERYKRISIAKKGGEKYQFSGREEVMNVKRMPATIEKGNREIPGRKTHAAS